VTESQQLMLAWLICFLVRIPRLVERWKAPFLCGPGWFFGVQVIPDFRDAGGSVILARYRLRLFLPWAVEIPLSLLLLSLGYPRAIIPIVIVITLLTRLAYYANRKAAEDAARRLQIPESDKPVVSVLLSLRPRSLRDYSNRWIETTIVGALVASLALLGSRSAISGDWTALRGPWTQLAIVFYMQVGLLLLKRGFVRARSVAPADNAEAYVTWRESLRRLSTTLCDYMRLVLVFPLLFADFSVFAERSNSRDQETLILIVVFVLMPLLGWQEWRSRLRHLQVTRETKPAGFLVRPDESGLHSLVCFRPELPMLLLRGPDGYSLNLASPSVRTAGLYFAGCALLLVVLTR
jgi:hypothetical protein